MSGGKYGGSGYEVTEARGQSLLLWMVLVMDLSLRRT